MTNEDTIPAGEKTPWRVIPNPDDGTSMWRARVVHDNGVATVVRGMFVDADVARDYAAVLNIIDGESIAAWFEARAALYDEAVKALEEIATGDLDGFCTFATCWPGHPSCAAQLATDLLSRMKQG